MRRKREWSALREYKSSLGMWPEKWAFTKLSPNFLTEKELIFVAYGPGIMSETMYTSLCLHIPSSSSSPSLLWPRIHNLLLLNQNPSPLQKILSVLLRKVLPTENYYINHRHYNDHLALLEVTPSRHSFLHGVIFHFFFFFPYLCCFCSWNIFIKPTLLI